MLQKNLQISAGCTDAEKPRLSCHTTGEHVRPARTKFPEMLVNIVNLFWSQFGRGNQTNYRYHTPKLGSCKTMNVYTEASTPNKWTIYWCDQGSRVKDWMVVAERFRPCKKNRINAYSIACRRHKKNGAMTSEGARKRQKTRKTTEKKRNVAKRETKMPQVRVISGKRVILYM
jgi:hypothetical protein